MNSMSGATPAPAPDTDFLQDVLAGLGARSKHLYPKYFYDAEGSRLFDRICDLPEYYPTRTELAIMREHAAEMGQAVGPEALLIEPGSGSSVKIRLLLDALQKPAGYVPVEISGEHLQTSAGLLAQEYPGLEVLPVCADFTRPFPVPYGRVSPRRHLVYFPGSTLGNFTPDAAVELLRQFRQVAGANGALLLGVDMQKDVATMEAAYNDSAGVTAAFNRNLLVRMNRELGADFIPERFRHRAVWNAAYGRIEMHLVSEVAQQVRIGGECIDLAAGEVIVTEYSHKFTANDLAALAGEAGFVPQRGWSDHRGWFSVQLWAATDPAG